MRPKTVTVTTLHNLIVKEVGDLVSIIQSVHTDLSARIDDVDAKLSARIDGVEASLNAKIDTVNENLGAKISGINARMDDLSNNHVRTEIHEGLEKRVLVLEKDRKKGYMLK